MRRDPDSAPSPARAGGRATAVALAVFAACVLYTFSSIWSQGFATFVPSVERPGKYRFTTEADVRLAVWGTSRNARVLTRAPWRFFEAETCYPVRRALTLGHPMLPLGLLGVPVRAVAPDPVATYNAVLALVFVASALAMYLLVVEWTGVPAAGIAAGALFAFHPVALDRVMHLQIYDLSWTVWALLFAERWCKRGRWRDALGLAAALVIQMGGSFYAAAICALVVAPRFAWLAWHARSRLRPAQVVAVLALALAGAALVYGPYLAARQTEDFERVEKFFLAWSEFLPRGDRDPGLWLWALAAIGLFARRTPAAGDPNGDARPALLVAALLTALAATGGVAGKRFFYDALAWIPGFATVRVPSVLAAGVHLALCALAGLGAARLLLLARPRFAWHAAFALVAVSLLSVLAPGTLGHARAPLYAFRARPSDAELDFYAALAAQGNAGPILELPVIQGPPEMRSRSVVRSAYHRRPVSTCFNSIRPRAYSEVETLGAALPARAAQRRARELGFTTIVVEHPPDQPQAQALRARFERARRAVPVPLLRPLLVTPERSAFTLAEP